MLMLIYRSSVGLERHGEETTYTFMYHQNAGQNHNIKKANKSFGMTVANQNL